MPEPVTAVLLPPEIGELVLTVIDVTVPVFDVLLFQVYFSPVVTNETSVPPLAAVLLEYVVLGGVVNI